MIVYNISIRILPEIEKEWIEWQKTEHIPDIMASGYFTDHSFYRLMDQDPCDGITYVLQYFATSMEAYQEYINEKAPMLREAAMQRWGDKFIAFRTVMEEV